MERYKKAKKKRGHALSILYMHTEPRHGQTTENGGRTLTERETHKKQKGSWDDCIGHRDYRKSNNGVVPDKATQPLSLKYVNGPTIYSLHSKQANRQSGKHMYIIKASRPCVCMDFLFLSFNLSNINPMYRLTNTG